MRARSKVRLSVRVSPTGDAAIFVTRPESDATWPRHVVRAAKALIARGLRIVGVSSAVGRPPPAP